MSRCYPFPPPGFVPNQVRDESLIEPIKKGTKEEVKREKKDRKHNKDKKRKERDNEVDRSRNHRHKRQRKDENANASKKVESLEKSCLTIELDHQASSQTSCDSTLRSNENDKSQPLNGRHNDSGEFVCLLVAGSVLLHVLATTMMTLFLRIVAMGFEETSTRVLLHDKGQKCPEVMMTTNKDQKQCSASSHRESIGPSKLCSKCPPSTAMRFLKLIENWAPDQFESKLADSEDQERWLLMKAGAKRRHQVSVKTSSKGSSSMVWPTAQILPEVELHALPFTVPF